MYKLILPCVFLFTACGLYAQGVNFITVTDEAQYEKASDFTNTYEIRILKGKAVGKCQAVRIEKNWYLTAAHCISPGCDETCDIQVRMIVTPGYEMDMAVKHSAKRRYVFKNEKATRVFQNASYDVALINVPAKTASHIYKIPSSGRFISEELFLRIIPDYNVYYKAVNGTNLPEVLMLSSKRLRALYRNVSVVSIWDGKREALHAGGPVFYSPKKKFLFTENFGIKQGISGSGVMTNTGELVGLVSATTNLSLKRDGVVEHTVPMAFIAPFDDYLIDFIKTHVPSFKYKEAGNAFLKAVPAKYRHMAQSLDNM
jgi:hypothetical protein